MEFVEFAILGLEAILKIENFNAKLVLLKTEL